MPRFRLPRSVVTLGVLAVFSLLAWSVVVGRHPGRIPDPVHHGRHASGWFEELVRTAGALGRDGERRTLEERAQVAP